MIKFVFHSHSRYSRDCDLAIERIEEKLIANGITHWFLTDHNRLSLKRYSRRVVIIPSEEINTSEGEIIGTFLKREIPPGLSLRSTLDEIHRQGGLAVAPHPFDRLRSKRMSDETLERHLDAIDIIETFNARSVFMADNHRARQFADAHRKGAISGSDAHTLEEYGLNWTASEDFRDAASFLRVLPRAVVHEQLAALHVHIATKLVVWRGRGG